MRVYQKCDYQSVNTGQTDGRTDRRRTKWSLCVVMLRRGHKNYARPQNCGRRSTAQIVGLQLKWVLDLVAYLRNIMPILEIVAGEAQLRSWVSNRKLTLGPNWILSPEGMVSRRLSSSTEFSDSIHSGSISPSQIIHDWISTMYIIIMLYNTRGHGQQTIVVQHGVQRLDPLGVNITITDNPWLDLYNVYNYYVI